MFHYSDSVGLKRSAVIDFSRGSTAEKPHVQKCSQNRWVLRGFSPASSVSKWSRGWGGVSQVRVQTLREKKGLLSPHCLPEAFVNSVHWSQGKKQWQNVLGFLWVLCPLLGLLETLLRKHWTSWTSVLWQAVFKSCFSLQLCLCSI